MLIIALLSKNLASAYVKIMMVELDRYFFWFRMVYWKDIIISGIKSMVILKKNLIASWSIINFLKNKITSVKQRQNFV